MINCCNDFVIGYGDYMIDGCFRELNLIINVYIWFKFDKWNNVLFDWCYLFNWKCFVGILDWL